MKTNNYLIIGLIAFLLLSCHTAEHIVILCTNDTHSQILPDQNNKGGYARRLGIIDTVRAQNKHVIMVDDGDFSQGTLFFNIFKGEVEIAGMNAMQYDAVAVGNHEFDNGVATFAGQMAKATFPLTCANYDVSNSVLAPYVKPYLIVKEGCVKVGIFGLGISPANLIEDTEFVPVRYLNPDSAAIAVAAFLKEKKKCDVVICISHLGSRMDAIIIGDSRYVDLVCGGHTHEMINRTIPNRDGKPVHLIQSGKGAANLGRVDLYLKR